jgi:MFS family permease
VEKAIYTVFLAGGPIVGGIAGGYIGFRVGWRYIFWVGMGLAGLCFLGVLFLVPETLFERPFVSAAATDAAEDDKPEEVRVESRQTTAQTYRPFTFTRSIGFTSPRGNRMQKFLQPWYTALLPGTWMVMLHYAGLVGGIVAVSTIGPSIVGAPPYLWGENVGLINVGGLIGSILGALYTYAVADSMLKRSARRERDGSAEPENRLPTMFPALAIATSGFFVFGFCAQYPSKNAWVGLQTGYAMIAFGLMQVPSVGFSYVSTSYLDTVLNCLADLVFCLL